MLGVVWCGVSKGGKWIRISLSLSLSRGEGGGTQIKKRQFLKQDLVSQG